MAKRLSDKLLREETHIPDSKLGREICRNCGGEVVVDSADKRSLDLPHRRICRKCHAEHGTTAATLYPARKKYDLPAPGFQVDDTWL